MEKVRVVVISPERMLFEGMAEEVIVPAREGGMSILSRHAPLLATLGKGIIRILDGTSKKEFDIESGFVEVSKKSPQYAGEENNFINIFVRHA